MTAQTSINFGKQLKEAGMKQSLDSANQVHPDWSEKCYRLFKVWIQYQSGAFKMETFRQGVQTLLEAPPSLRAFGPITARARKEGLIRHVGYAQVENPKAHRATSSLWQRV